jgi:hypothetical protein
MDPDFLRVDERYAVELMKTRAIADRRPFDERYPMDAPRWNSADRRVVVTINGKDYSREELLGEASSVYACTAFAS